MDSDNDSICDALDLCPNFDDNLDDDLDTIPDDCDTCPLIRNLTDQNFNYVSTSAQNEIYSTLLILSGDNISYQAGNFILLTASFEVELNANFEAVIDTCN